MQRIHFFILLFIPFFTFYSCTGTVKKQSGPDQQRDWHYFGQPLPGEEAVLFAPGIISTEHNERDFALSPDGHEIFYTLVLPANNLSVILHLAFDGAFWSGIEIASFSGKYNDLEPAFSTDGNKLFFASTRPLSAADTTDDWNIWYVQKAGSNWSDPKPVDPPVNTGANEFYPGITGNGNLYFTATRSEGFGKEDIYCATLKNDHFDNPVNLGSNINTAGYEFNAFIAPDESYILFSSVGRPDGMGGGDLYISYRESDTSWSPARNLGSPVNSNKLDYCPFVSPDGKYLFFTSHRADSRITDREAKSFRQITDLMMKTENGFGNIYWTPFDPDAWKN